MSASLLAISTSIASQTGQLAALSSFLNPIPQANIGGAIPVQTNIEESMTDTLEITENPVEQGAAVTDHSYVRPPDLIMRCGWSNAQASAALNYAISLIDGSSMSVGDYVSSVYSRLLALQSSRQPFTVTTSIRQYQNMLIKSLALTRDAATSQALMVTVTMRQIILVSAQTATLPPMANQANPANTAETMNLGTVNLVPGIPSASPGGALPPSEWGPPTPSTPSGL